MKYRKKPVVIEAFCWTGGPDQTEDPEWADAAVKAGKIWFSNPGTKDVCLEIATLEGTMCARQGDYIIRGVKGEIYPCKPDIFAATYEPAPGPGVVEVVEIMTRLQTPPSPKCPECERKP